MRTFIARDGSTLRLVVSVKGEELTGYVSMPCRKWQFDRATDAERVKAVAEYLAEQPWTTGRHRAILAAAESLCGLDVIG